MQDTQPIGQALAATHCNEDTTSRQSPSKRKARIQSQSKQGNGSSQTTPSSRYTRSQAAPDWTVQEVLVLLSEIVSIDEVWLKELSSYQRWKMISDSCIAMNVVRSSNQCKRKWEILLDDYKKIINWEPQSREDSYWFLPEERRTDYGLPVSFQKEVFDAMDAVIQIHLQQSDSSNSDPERLINGSEFERSKMNAGSDTWRKDVKCSDLKDAINAAAPGKLTVLFISEVSRAFHPNFAAKWRRYFYIFPLEDGLQIQVNSNHMDSSSSMYEADGLLQQQAEHIEDDDGAAFYWGKNCFNNVDIPMKPSNFSVDKVNQLLRQLEGRSLSYRVFARDTKASRSSGPPTECFVFHARAVEATLPCINKDSKEEIKVMCVELVANRFLRKMVRVLVATAIREAAAGADADALLNLMNATCRRATAPPAPPDGLCLIDVGYEDFNRQNSLIL